MSLWPGRPLFGYKIGPVATPAALQIVAGNISSASNRPKMQSCEVKGPEDTFIAHMMLKYVYSDLSHIMLWVAGGNCATKMCNRIRGERCRGTRRVTLPYLQLV